MLHDQTLVYLTTFKPDMGEHDSDVFELMYIMAQPTIVFQV